ncbi:WG repeat-containing protein [Tenacibaculum agarivorans]|uniref:WG repeat-containing protein n=1 Tax=Tenacibaculum agarivorans TaxID=1908389 RepID=UPI00094BAB62|nr:WG repeat-containing protein [Tenacibaculum agarivorans]
MKKQITFVCLWCTLLLVSQTKKVEGLLSANKFTGIVISEYDGTHFWVTHNSKYKIVDNKGNIVYTDIGMKNTFQPGKNSATLKNSIFEDYDTKKYASRFISIKNKKPLSDFVYQDIISFNNDTYLAVKNIQKKREYIYLDKELKILYKTDLNQIAKKMNLSFSEKMRFNNPKLKRFFGAFNDGLTKIYNPKKNKFGFVNRNGKTVIPEVYKVVNDFSEGLASFKTDDNLYGFINTKGEKVIPAKYSKQPYSFLSGRAKVLSKSGFFGYIDSKDDLVIDVQYRFATNFYKGYALVQKDEMSPVLLIDKNGTVVKEFGKDIKVKFQEKAHQFLTPAIHVEYLTHVNSTLQQLVDFKKGIFINRFNRYGLLDMEGNVILDFKYSSLKDYNNGLVLAIYKDKNNIQKQGLLNEKGEFVVEVGESKF